MKLLPPRHGVLVESELGQAFVRCYAAFAVLAGFLLVALGSPPESLKGALACVLAYVGYAYAWLWLVARTAGSTLVRQRSALFLDHIVYATCFALGGRPVAVLAWVAVTTSVGHGLRFGERRGIAAACVGSAAIFAAVELGPAWQLPLTIAAGMAVTALVVPVYVVRLVRTIARQRQDAEARAEALEHAVRIDTLTGILSRAGFNEALRKMQANANAVKENLGLVYLDLDGFKAINDTKGHDAGDLVLREIAQLLVSVVRGSDAVARLGGDEFAIVVHSPIEESALALVASKAAEAISAWRHPELPDEKLGASAGVALVAPGDSVAEGLKLADMRMFEMKRQRSARRRIAVATESQTTRTES